MRQSAVVLALGWLLAPLQFVTAVVVAREVGPEAKGALALMTGLTAILVSVVAFGVPSGAAALYPRAGYSRAEVIATSLALTCGTSTLMVLAYLFAGDGVLAALLSRRDIELLNPLWLLLAVLTVIPAALAAVADVVLIAANAMRTYSVRMAVSGLLGVALTWIWTVQLDWGVAGALASYPVSATFGLGLFAGWWVREPGSQGARVAASCARSLLRVGVQQHVISLIALVAKRIDVFLVASLLSLQDAGFYAAGILIPQAIVTLPRATMWPLVSALSAKGGEVTDAVVRICRVQVVFIALVSVVIAALAPVLVPLLFGPTFSPAVQPLRWAVLGLAFTPITITVNAILTARERPGLSILPAVAGTVVQLGLTLLLIRSWGASASAAGLSANFAVTAVLQLAIARSQNVAIGAMVVPRRTDLDLVVKALRARVSA